MSPYGGAVSTHDEHPARPGSDLPNPTDPQVPAEPAPADPTSPASPASPTSPATPATPASPATERTGSESTRTPRLLVHVAGLRPTLSPAEDRVAQQVLSDARATAAMTISELAVAARTSETTVLRFCRRIGLPGYPQLRLALAEEGASPRLREAPSSDISPDDTLDDVVAKIAYSEVSALEDTAEHLDRQVLEEVAGRVARSRRIGIYGHGASALVAADLQHKLQRIGLFAVASGDPHLALASAALHGPQDVAIGISHSGTTHETLEELGVAREQGALTVALTNFPRSPLARAADRVLVTAARETQVRAGATASRIAGLFVVDCLYIAVAHHDITAAQRAVSSTREAVQRHRVAPDSAEPSA